MVLQRPFEPTAVTGKVDSEAKTGRQVSGQFRLWVGKSFLLFFQQNFRGLNHRRNRVAHLEVHLFGASPGDYTFNEVVSDTDNYVGHNSAELKLSNFSFEPVASR